MYIINGVTAFYIPSKISVYFLYESKLRTDKASSSHFAEILDSQLWEMEILEILWLFSDIPKSILMS